ETTRRRARTTTSTRTLRLLSAQLVQEAGPNRERTMEVRVGVQEERAVRHVAQQERPHGGEEQCAGEHQEARVAEREFEANTQTRASLHCVLLHAASMR